MNEAIFSQLDFGPLKEFLNDDNVTDVSYSNGGQVWLKTLDKGIYRVDRPDINNALFEKLAFQCSNVMGKTFNMASPFLDAESAELRLNFVHESIATNGIACVIRKTPAKIRLNREKLLNEDYISESVLDFLITCVHGHCNIMVSGETGSGKTELVKYLASNTAENEKIITIEDTLELHLDKIYPHRDIVAMKTNNIASYTEVLVTCMRQNPKWILLSEVRSAEAVTAVRNSISSGHNIISTIHSDSAANIPMRLYSLMESSQDVQQFLNSIHRYVQLGVHVKGFMDNTIGKFKREIVEVSQFYVNDNNEPSCNVIFKRNLDGRICYHNPTHHLYDYLGSQGVILEPNIFDAEIANNPPEETEEVKSEPAVNPVQPIAEQPTATPVQPQAAPQPMPVQQPTQSVQPAQPAQPVQVAQVQQPVANPQPSVVQPQVQVSATQVAPVQPQVPQMQVQGQAPNQPVQPQIPAVPTGTA